MHSVYIKPNTTADGAPFKVRLPNKPHEFLSESGMEVERTPYWQRRICDGSVVVAKKPKAATIKVNQENN